jgi:hypothetical protein
MFVNNLLPFLNKNMYSQPVKVAVLPLQLLVHHVTAPHHPHNVAFAGCLSKNSDGARLPLQVGCSNTVHPISLMTMVCTLVCGLAV